MKKDGKQTIKALQDDNDYVIMNNPLASPKFIREIGKDKFSPIEKDTYTPKVFYEIASRLSSAMLENVKRNENIVFELNIKQFLTDIGANTKNFDYLIKTVKSMQSVLLTWKEGEKGNRRTITVPIISKSIHHENTGKIELFVDIDLARHILEVSEKENFSFLKSNLFSLQNAQAIKLYPFFESWANYGKPYIISVEDFKIRFGYDTSGYLKYSNLELKVLKPATEEINEKSDITVNYEPTGDNLDGLRPRITGLIFYSQRKKKPKQEQKEIQEQAPNKPQDEPTHISNLIPKVAPQEPKHKTPQPTANEPTEAQIFELGRCKELKFKDEEIQRLLQKFNYDYIEVWQRLKATQEGVKDGTVINKDKPLGYAIGSEIIGVGLWKAEQEKAKKRETDRIESEKKLFIEKLQKEYNERRNKQFNEIYNKSTPEEIEPYYDRFRAETNKWNMNFFLDLETNKFKETGIYIIGEELAENKGFGKEYRQNKFRVETFEKYHLQIDFTPKEEIIIISLFEQEPQPQTIEAIPRPTVPQLTTPLPHAQEPSEPIEKTPPENFATNENKKTEGIENTEAPKSIGNLLKNFFR
jgi:plasmid replication initiation protein